jgi:hypothetical protein
MKIIKLFKYKLLASATHDALNNVEMSHLSIEGATVLSFFNLRQPLTPK